MGDTITRGIAHSFPGSEKGSVAKPLSLSQPTMARIAYGITQTQTPVPTGILRPQWEARGRKTQAMQLVHKKRAEPRVKKVGPLVTRDLSAPQAAGAAG